MLSVNSRQKGKRGELALAKRLREYGYEARRGVQYNGADGSADVIGLDGIHIECKRVERLNLRDAMLQSVHDAKEGEIPTVMHKRNNDDWLVTMRLDDWIEFYRRTTKREQPIYSGLFGKSLLPTTSK